MRVMTLFLIMISMSATGQVVVNGGRTFLGPLDATNATRTQPFRMGNSANRPVSCVQGEVYFQTDAVPGQNLHFCTAANVWSAMSGGEGGGSGSVMSVGLALPAEFVVSGSPVTGSGTVSGVWAPQAQGTVLAAPPAATGVPAFRSLAVTDIPPVAIGGVTGLQAALDSKQAAGSYATTGAGNTYAAGAKQTFTPSAGTAGVRITAGTLPAEPVAGDLAIDSVSANALKYYDGSAWKSTGGTGGGAGSSIMTGSGGALSVGQGGTSYLAPGQISGGSTESSYQLPMPRSGVAANLMLRTSTPQPASQTLTCTVRKNGADSAVVVTVPAGAGVGVFSSAGGTASFAAGDMLSIGCMQQAGTSPGAAIRMFALEYQQ